MPAFNDGDSGADVRAILNTAIGAAEGAVQNAGGVANIRVLTRAEHAALDPEDPDTLYIFSD